MRSAILLNVDGDQVALPPERVAELVGFAIGTLNVEWWFSDSVDLTCCFSYEPFGWEKQTYYLDGLTLQEVREVERALFEQMLASPADVIALIVDETGKTAEFDWDSLIRGDSLRVDVMPEALVLDSSILSRVGGISSEASGVGIGPNLRLLIDRNWEVPHVQ
ncbi:hypothetical protein ACFWBN_24645 [Streptomyces sp. NPDC059989]|uniref:hypothetical protein n=1 Tax=Streptomyces sp. NPDC059989 TaxID=3347026 RepID=UPI003691A830